MDIYDVAQDATQIATATNKSEHWYIYPSLTIHKLPDKLLLHIFSFLKHQGLGKVARVCKKWRLLAYDPRLWKSVSLRPEYGGLHVQSVDTLQTLIGIRFGATMKYTELPCELITSPILHELANKCPNLAYMTLDFANAMQLHDFNDLNAFPCNLRSLCICLSEVIFLEGFMRRIYSCLSSLEVLHLIETQPHIHDNARCFYNETALESAMKILGNHNRNICNKSQYCCWLGCRVIATFSAYIAKNIWLHA